MITVPERPRLPILLALAVTCVLLASCTRGRETTGPDPTSLPGTVPGATVPPGTTKPAVTPSGTATEATLTTKDGRERTYHLYVPPTVPADRPVPLLIALHGGTGWGEQFERNSGFDGIAEANGFIVVYPDGIEIGPLFPRGRVWNGGDCCGPASKQQVDDVGFISQLIDTVESSHTIDRARIYAAGHSNGGVLSYKLACDLSEKIVAVGLQAGWPAFPPDTCRPTKPVSLLQLHGTADQNVPVEGGVGSRSLSGSTVPPVLDSVRVIATRDGCPDQPAHTTAGDLDTRVWSPCREGTTVELIQVAGASHAWMGHPGNAIQERIVGESYKDLDASAEIWAFLAAHPRA